MGGGAWGVGRWGGGAVERRGGGVVRPVVIHHLYPHTHLPQVSSGMPLPWPGLRSPFFGATKVDQRQ